MDDEPNIILSEVEFQSHNHEPYWMACGGFDYDSGNWIFNKFNCQTSEIENVFLVSKELGDQIQKQCLDENF